MQVKTKIYTLSNITTAIENVIKTHASTYFWVKVEIVKLNYYPQSGHCYPDLVEKKGGKIIAEMNGVIWSDTFININKHFKEIVGEPIGNHMSVVCKAKVTYSAVHGLSLQITDINPEFTLGELAKQKNNTIKKLKNEGLFNLNKTKKLAQLPKTIAVISVSTSKGYEDFLSVISKNSWGYKFHLKLFPAILQGSKSITTIIQQLNRIKTYPNVFDAVAIIRGGGGDIGLSSYDDYQLSKVIASYPIPVLTGIGHATNQTVTEMVSHQSFITPTKVSEFLLQKFHEFSIPVIDAQQTIENYANELFKANNNQLKETSRLFNSLASNYLKEQKNLLNNYSTTIANTSKNILLESNNKLTTILVSLKSASNTLLSEQEASIVQFNKYLTIYSKIITQKARNNLEYLEKNISLLSPINILKRGFSITRFNGNSLTDTKQLKNGDRIVTQLANGELISNIKK